MHISLKTLILVATTAVVSAVSAYFITHNQPTAAPVPAAAVATTAPAASAVVPPGMSATEQYHQILLEKMAQQEKDAQAWRDYYHKRSEQDKAEAIKHEPLWKPLKNH